MTYRPKASFFYFLYFSRAERTGVFSLCSFSPRSSKKKKIIAAGRKETHAAARQSFVFICNFRQSSNFFWTFLDSSCTQCKGKKRALRAGETINLVSLDSAPTRQQQSPQDSVPRPTKCHPYRKHRSHR